MINRTKVAYEEYLNEVLEHEDTPQLAVKLGTYLASPARGCGRMTRYNLRLAITNG